MSSSHEALDAWHEQQQAALKQLADDAKERKRPGKRKRTWPMVSNAMGVHPDQIPEFMEDARKHGIALNFTPDGGAIFESPGQRKEYCRIKGEHDRNGGYGDP